MKSETASFREFERNQPCCMVVDDNDDILQMTAFMLKNLTDATVECFDTPAAALAAFSSEPGRYALVITDFGMPVMDGIELCHRMRAICPSQKIFLATGSGFFTEAVARHAGFSELVNKPFPLTTLRRHWPRLDWRLRLLLVKSIFRKYTTNKQKEQYENDKKHRNRPGGTRHLCAAR